MILKKEESIFVSVGGNADKYWLKFSVEKKTRSKNSVKKARKFMSKFRSNTF